MAAVVTIIPSMQGLGTVTGTTQRTRNEHKKDAQICWLKKVYSTLKLYIYVSGHISVGVSVASRRISGPLVPELYWSLNGT